MEQDGCFKWDLEKYYRIELGSADPPLRLKWKLWFTHLGFHCVAIYRLSRYCRKAGLNNVFQAALLAPISELLCFLARFLFHADIFAASIGPGFYIGHVGTIYIGPTRVGANFSLAHNVTVGRGVSEGQLGIPIIGDDVWIGTGSVLYGNINIGHGVTINCGSILSRSVADRCLVGGNPARVLQRDFDNTELFRHHAMKASEQSSGGATTTLSEPPSSLADETKLLQR